MREFDSMKWAAIFFALVAVAAAVWFIVQPSHTRTGAQRQDSIALSAGALATVKLPNSFTEQEQIGASAYDAVCSACHGRNAQAKMASLLRLFTRSMNPATTATWRLSSQRRMEFGRTTGNLTTCQRLKA